MPKKLTYVLFFLTLASLPFANLPGLPSPGPRVQYTELLFLGSFLCFVVSVALGQLSFKKGSFYLPVLCYAAAAAVSSAFSIEPRTSLLKLVGITYLAALSILAFNLIRDERSMRGAIMAWLAGTGVACAYACAIFVVFYIDRGSIFVTYGLSHYGTFPPGNYPRINSLFANPNMFCHFLSISWLFLFVSLDRKWIGKWLGYTLGTAMIFSTVMTLSPGIGTFFLTTGLWIFWKWRTSGSVLPKAALAAGLAAAAVFFAVTTVKVTPDLAVSNDPSARVLTWKSAANTFLSYPLTGKGLGTNAARVKYEEQTLLDAHNLFLNVAAESGTIGLAAVLFLAWFLISRAYRTMSADGPGADLAAALTIAFVGAFLYQGLSGSFEDARHLWVLIGFLGVVVTPDPEGGAHE